MIDNWTDHLVAQNSATASLLAGQRYDIRMDYYDHATLATARLSWAYPGQSTQIVPQWVLYPALPVNQPPAVNAGVDQTINLPAVASLTGMAHDDGSAESGEPDDDVEQDQRARGFRRRHGRVRQPERAGDDGDIRRRRDLRAAAHRERRSGDGQRRRDDHGQSRADRSVAGTGLLGEYFNDPQQRLAFRARSSRGRLDPTVNFDWASSRTGTGRVRRQLLGRDGRDKVQAPVERQLHVHDHRPTTAFASGSTGSSSSTTGSIRR